MLFFFIIPSIYDESLTIISAEWISTSCAELYYITFYAPVKIFSLISLGEVPQILTYCMHGVQGRISGGSSLCHSDNCTDSF